MRSSRKRLHSQRAQIDARHGRSSLSSEARPRFGWIRATRESLGMTVQQLGRRMGVTKAAAQKLEASEARGSISLKSLERAAAALGCKLFYDLLPEEGSLDAALQGRSLELARRKLSRVAHSMALEEQTVRSDASDAQVRALAADIKARLPTELWDS